MSFKNEVHRGTDSVSCLRAYTSVTKGIEKEVRSVLEKREGYNVSVIRLPNFQCQRSLPTPLRGKEALGILIGTISENKFVVDYIHVRKSLRHRKHSSDILDCMFREFKNATFHVRLDEYTSKSILFWMNCGFEVDVTNSDFSEKSAHIELSQSLAKFALPLRESASRLLSVVDEPWLVSLIEEEVGYLESSTLPSEPSEPSDPPQPPPKKRKTSLSSKETKKKRDSTPEGKVRVDGVVLTPDPLPPPPLPPPPSSPSKGNDVDDSTPEGKVRVDGVVLTPDPLPPPSLPPPPSSPSEGNEVDDSTPEGKVRVDGVVLTPDPLPPPSLPPPPRFLDSLNVKKWIEIEGENVECDEFMTLATDSGTFTIHDFVYVSPDDEDDSPDIGLLHNFYKAPKGDYVSIQMFWRSDEVPLSSSPHPNEVFKTNHFCIFNVERIVKKCDVSYLQRGEEDGIEFGENSFFFKKEYDDEEGVFKDATYVFDSPN